MSDIRDDFAYWPPFTPAMIEKVLPHRYPFLLCDGITEFTQDSVRGYKMLSFGEGTFAGHFPGHPVYPGVLQIETVAQIGACWILSRKENVGKIAYLMTVEEAKFRRPALPGMRLDVFGKITNLKSRTGKIEAEITCEGQLISSATLLFAFSKENNGSAGQ